MKLIVNIPEIKTQEEFIVLDSKDKKKIKLSELETEEKNIYFKFMELTNNSDFFELEGFNEEMLIHRLCNHTPSENKYIEFESLIKDEKKVVEDFIKMVKNK